MSLQPNSKKLNFLELKNSKLTTLEAKEVGVIEGPIPLGVDKSLSLPLDIGPVVCKFVGRFVELNEFKINFGIL